MDKLYSPESWVEPSHVSFMLCCGLRISIRFVTCEPNKGRTALISLRLFNWRLILKYIRYYFSYLYLKSDRTMFCFMGFRYISQLQLFVDSLSSETSPCALCLHSDMSAGGAAQKNFSLFSLLSHVLIFCCMFDCVRNSCIRLLKEREREKKN